MAKLNSLCCTGCKHHDPSGGCRAEKPLACKTWLCPAIPKPAPLHQRLWALSRRAQKAKLAHFRSDKPSSIEAALQAWNKEQQMAQEELRFIEARILAKQLLE